MNRKRLSPQLYSRNMRNFRFAAACFLGAACISCSPAVGVKCTVDGLAGGTVVLKHFDVGGYSAVDTLRTDANGVTKFKVPVAPGDPEFVYLFHGDTKIASLLLENGQKKVTVNADTLGNFSVSGSPTSEELRVVEQDFASYLGKLSLTQDKDKFVKDYVEYYRSRVKYVMEHPYSLTVVPVLFQKINQYSPVFAQTTDALHFRSACDSLKTVYPESRYVKALEKETVRRENAMKLEYMVRNTEPSGFPDIVLPDMKGRKVALSSVKAKVILLHFWTAESVEQKMINTEVLKPLYDDFAKKGFEIYSVCLDTDKVRWGTVVSGQKLPWINVCDGLGALCPAVTSYNVADLPCSVLIADGTVSTVGITGIAGLRKELSRLLI